MKRKAHYLAMLALLLAATAAVQYLSVARGREHPPARKSLTELPTSIAGWTQVEEQRLTDRELSQLGPDDYLSRTYKNEAGAIAYLFIAYYASQRQRQTFHSPQNCLPGAGWSMRDHRLHALAGGQVNEYLIEKDSTQMAAFYWYEGRGRTEASEYLGRWHTITDSIWKGRTDGALVRVIVLAGKRDEDVAAARTLGLDFSRALTPLLGQFIPD